MYKNGLISELSIITTQMLQKTTTTIQSKTEQHMSTDKYYITFKYG